MKRQLIYTICAVLLLTVAVIGSTYAYFTATAGGNNNTNTASSDFEIIYTGGTEISGNMPITSDKTEAFKTTVNISSTQASVEAVATIYLNIETITPNLRIEGFVWELYGYKNNQQVVHRSGTFNGYNDTTNNIVNLIENYPIDNTNTAFTLYLWIDGTKTNNNVLGGEFLGYIGARTERITGTLE